ncbi:hypothetical protein GCM10009640_22280 [Agrococcus citreus]|uniref:DUF4878 domain-containing protein n=2 Tax=Agrococcus citreus TaxID=84643 RepID=A0ABN1YXL0_9MICO
MPEFAMPPERASSAERPARTAKRRRRVAGAVLAALVVIGGSTAAIVQAVQRDADAAAAGALTAAALEYLGAISEGGGDAATAMVPVDGPAPLLGDAALVAAVGIQDLGVEGVEVDGDAATVVVQFRAGEQRVERRLEAVRDGGSWRLTTTVAERVVLDSAGLGALPEQLGASVDLVEGTLLYPGVYRTESFEHGIVTVEAATVVVDGDPGTAQPREPPRWRVPGGVLDEARALALSHATACQATGACAVPSGALLGLGDQATVDLGPDSAVEFVVPLRVLRDGTGEPTQLEVGVRARATAWAGIDWQCSAPIPRGSEPPAERAWEPCA